MSRAVTFVLKNSRNSFITAYFFMKKPFHNHTEPDGPSSLFMYMRDFFFFFVSSDL